MIFIFSCIYYKKIIIQVEIRISKFKLFYLNMLNKIKNYLNIENYLNNLIIKKSFILCNIFRIKIIN